MTADPKILQEMTFAHGVSARSLFDLEPVLFDRAWFSGEREKGDRDVYFMYREGFLSPGDHEVMRSNGIRFDITRIPAGCLGAEYVKTMGHYHPKTDGGTGRLSYPEVYQVISGNAVYLMQKRDMSEIIVIEARAGDVVLIPPEFGHVTINASDEELLMSNWVADTFASDYGTILENRGFAYYLTKTGLAANPLYKKSGTPLPRVSFMTPGDHPGFGLFCGEDMYGLIRTPEKLAFLRAPELFFPQTEK